MDKTSKGLRAGRAGRSSKGHTQRVCSTSLALLVLALSLSCLCFPTLSYGGWTPIGPYGGKITALAIDTVSPYIAYAGTRHGVFKTTDGGANWKLSGTGLPINYNECWECWVSSLAVDPANPQIVYAGIANGLGGVFKTTDGGANWSAVNTGLTSMDIRSLAISAKNTKVVYAGTNDGKIFRTTSGGAGWKRVLAVPANRTVTSIAIDRSTEIVYAGTWGNGVYQGYPSGLSMKWGPVNKGLTNTFVTSLAIDPKNYRIIYAGTRGGVFKTTNSYNWTPVNKGLTNGRINSLVIDRANTQVVYAGTDGGVFKTTSGGATWNAVNTAAGVFSLAINPANTQIIYAGVGYRGVFKTINGGTSWTLRSRGITDIRISSLAIDPAMPWIVYAGGSNMGVFRTTNGGATWTPVNNGLPYWSLVSALAISPAKPSIVYAGEPEYGVYKTTNSGGAWTEVMPLADPIEVNLAVDTMNPQIVYVGTENGVDKTTNGGANWNNVNTGLTITWVTSFAIDPTNTKIVYAGTWGGGVFKTKDGGFAADSEADGTDDNGEGEFEK